MLHARAMSLSTPSSSGRSSPAPRSDASSSTSAGAVPIPGNSKSDSTTHQQQGTNPSSSPFGSGAFGQRRGSAPASAFLAPRFNWSAATSGAGAPGGITSYAHGAYGTSPSQQSSSTAFDANGVPRRTSFGHSLTGGRLSALAALGMAPMHSPPVQSTGPPQTGTLSKTTSINSEVLPPLSASSTPVSSPALKSTKSTPDVSTTGTASRRKDRVFFLPGPDGLCVESRRRRPSEA